MWMVGLGASAFLFFYLYDYLQIRRPEKTLGVLFFSGIFLLVASTGGLIASTAFRASKSGLLFALALFFAAIFLVLLIYTLFFALPYDKTYEARAEKRVLVSTGVYALCRHPGILWFSALYFFLWAAFGGGHLLWAFLLFSALNVIYALLQDRWVFPRQFEGYGDYQKTTPFLMPNPRSIRACLSTIR